MKSADGVFAIGDCTAPSYAPTAQVAAQEGSYLARVLKQLAKRDAQLSEAQALPDTDPEKKTKIETLESQHAKLEKLGPFRYSHQGSLAYIGQGNCGSAVLLGRELRHRGVATCLFWRSAYLSKLFSLRNRALVATDWMKAKLFGRCVPLLSSSRCVRTLTLFVSARSIPILQ
ncbi:hypothetical protein BDW22DRAFT_612563 [Trametopsis cervina]|nr:hypothetical protein BDW22DRAFT_612563 [Trametopsis cervina]